MVIQDLVCESVKMAGTSFNLKKKYFNSWGGDVSVIRTMKSKLVYLWTSCKGFLCFCKATVISNIYS